MIGQIQGNLSFKKNDRLIVDVQGVGYEITIPASTFYKLPDLGLKVNLYIHTHVREDNIQLYGFLSALEKECFQLLMTVSGVGPKVALSIMSELSPQDMTQSILTSNLSRLSAITGIGKKTAERLVLELKEKVKKLSTVIVASDAPMASGVFNDLVSALTNLGYKSIEIDRTIHAIREQLTDKNKFEDLLKASLNLLRA
ncbi:Holliday junction branch migration protein RuvA [Candidatus Woesearchaeota archaeon]|nr:Holliday junction branch migration protein RuvA [Candidatus Woesearchaeota archaeon]